MEEGNSHCWHHVTNKIDSFTLFLIQEMLWKHTALTVPLLCYFCSSPSLTPILPRNLCSSFFCCCCLSWPSSGWEAGNPNRKKKKSNLLIYRKCTRSNNIFNRIALEFRGIVDLWWLARKWVLRCRPWAAVPLPPVTQINCHRAPDLSIAAVIISLLWLTEGPVSLCPEINDTQADERKKWSDSRHTIHPSWIAMPSVLHLVWVGGEQTPAFIQ